MKKQIEKEIQEALRKGEKVRLSTLRLLLNALHNEEIALQRQLSEREELAVVRRQIKQRQESIEAYKKAGREDLVSKEERELEILKEFLPPQMEREELEQIVEEVINKTEAGQENFGKIMGEVMRKVEGKADGSEVVEIVRRKLSAH